MTDYMTANTINDLFRSLFALLDRAAYMMLGWMYEILFNVASADIFANDTVQKFYGRIQMIIGVFMLFKLAVSIIQGIINPDTFTDKKSGFSHIISRVVFALIMLTVLTPINIPGARSSYEINLNNNGLLFGTLYELQDRILENNTLGRLILGTNDGTVGSGSGGTNTALTQAEKLKKSSNMFTATILKGFIRINMKESGGMDETNPDDRVCDYIDQEVLDVYADLETSPNQLLSLVNASCEYQGNDGFFDTMAAFFTRLFTGDRYVFAYMPIISTIVAAVFIYILLGEIITIAIRSIKLAVLRLLAPIPIISYIDPKSEKDGAFAAWTKSLTSTYLELFIHLAVIYFVIFLIQDMIVNGLVINTGTGVIGVISCIFIWIGLFFFVKQAPKFIKDILGVKGGSSNVGLAGLLGGTAMLAGGGGMSGFALGAMQGFDAAVQGNNQGKAAPLGAIWTQNSNKMAQIRTGDKDAQGGLWGQAMDRFNYDTREAQARRLGIGSNDVADAKYIKDQREAEANNAKRNLDFAAREVEYAKAEMEAARYELDRTAEGSTERTSAEARYRAAQSRYADAQTGYTTAYTQNEAYQEAYGKASSTYEKMDKDRAQMGVGPRISDKRGDRATYRSPHKADGTYTPYTADETGRNAPRSEDDIKGTITGHSNDLKNFSGTTDDSGIGSMGGGARGGGPGPGRP